VSLDLSLSALNYSVTVSCYNSSQNKNELLNKDATAIETIN